MVSWRVHLLGWVAVFLFLSWFIGFLGFSLSGWDLLMGFVFGCVGSLLPDVDTPSSKARRGLAVFQSLGGLALLAAYLLFRVEEILYLLGLVLASMLGVLFLRHRGAAHSPIFGLIVCSPAFLVSSAAGVFCLSGFLSHLILDQT